MLIVRPDMLKNVVVSDIKLASNAQTKVIVSLDSLSATISVKVAREIFGWTISHIVW